MKHCFWVLLLLPTLAFALPNKPQEVVQEIFTKAGNPAIASDPAKQAEVTASVDFAALAKAALGKNYKTAAPKDFEWFRATLQEIIARTVFPKAPDFLKGVKINYDEVKE